eukprot:scaffold67373_cov69-Phaeocystis_antarctica.AAC.4
MIERGAMVYGPIGLPQLHRPAFLMRRRPPYTLPGWSKGGDIGDCTSGRHACQRCRGFPHASKRRGLPSLAQRAAPSKWVGFWSGGWPHGPTESEGTLTMLPRMKALYSQRLSVSPSVMPGRSLEVPTTRARVRARVRAKVRVRLRVRHAVDDEGVEVEDMLQLGYGRDQGEWIVHVELQDAIPDRLLACVGKKAGVAGQRACSAPFWLGISGLVFDIAGCPCDPCPGHCRRCRRTTPACSVPAAPHARCCPQARTHAPTAPRWSYAEPSVAGCQSASLCRKH